MKTLFILFLAFCPISSAFASAPVKVTWRGELRLWRRPAACEVPTPECILPQRIAMPIPVEITFTEPITNGKHVVSRTSYTTGDWKIDLMIAWVKPQDRTPQHWILQSRLTHNRFGIINECSRYDAAGAFKFLPPGSCTGRLGPDIIGLSFISPLAAKKTSL